MFGMILVLILCEKPSVRLVIQLKSSGGGGGGDDKVNNMDGQSYRDI